MTNHELARKLMEYPEMPVCFSIDDHAATGHAFEADPAILPMTFAAKSGDKFDCLLLDLGSLPDVFESVNVKILFEAIGTKDTVEDICNNFCEGYPEFSSNMEEEDYKFDEKTGKFSLLWSGDFEEGELDEDSMNTLIRLTHHAEGFYEGTDAEHVHVEVCVNGEWHGRSQEAH